MLVAIARDDSCEAQSLAEVVGEVGGVVDRISERSGRIVVVADAERYAVLRRRGSGYDRGERAAGRVCLHQDAGQVARRR